MKKYELLKSGKPGLFRIKALRSFSDVKEGDIGGYVESEDNLSHDGNCWIYDNATAFSKARVVHNAVLRNNSLIYGNAYACDNSKILDSVCVCGNAIVAGDCSIYGSAKIFDNADIGGCCSIFDTAQIFGKAKIHELAIVHGNTKIAGNVEICGKVAISADVLFRGNITIVSIDDFIIFKNWWSSGRYFVWTRQDDMWSVGCFHGTGKELIKKAYQDSKNKGREYKRVVKYVEAVKKIITCQKS